MGLEVYESMFRNVRAQIFGRWEPLRDLIAEQGYEWTREELREWSHQAKAWTALRARLHPSQVAQARRAGESWALSYNQYVDLIRRLNDAGRWVPRVENVEDAIDALYLMIRDRALVPPLIATPPRNRGWSYAGPSPWDLGSFADELRRRLGGPLLAELVKILGGLLDEFVAQLEVTQTFELPPYLPPSIRVDIRSVGAPGAAGGVAGVGVAGLEILETGDTLVLSANPGAGSAVSVTSPPLHGPSVVERMFFANDGNVTGAFQLVILPGGAAVPGATAPAGVVGESLFLTAGGAAGRGAQVQIEPMVEFGEWWPRRFIPYTGYRLVFSVSNTAAFAGWVALSVDRRDVRRRTS